MCCMSPKHHLIAFCNAAVDYYVRIIKIICMNVRFQRVKEN